MRVLEEDGDMPIEMEMVGIGMRLKELRKHSGLSQKSLAEYLNIDQSLVARHEAGERPITSTTLEKLAALYCCPASSILKESQCGESIGFAFRSNQIGASDLEALAAINRIVLNQMQMDGII